jgi:hypothetical protein
MVRQTHKADPQTGTHTGVSCFDLLPLISHAISTPDQTFVLGRKVEQERDAEAQKETQERVEVDTYTQARRTHFVRQFSVPINV